MGSGALRMKGVAAAVSLIALLLTALAPGMARAGVIWVTDGNMNAGQTGSCSAFGAYGDLSVFFAQPGCPMSLEAVGTVPAGENAFWLTTAPPGITINTAWTGNPDVISSGIADGFAVGDFWENSSGVYGGSTLGPGQEWFNTGLEGSSNINSQTYGIQLVCTHAASQGPCYGSPYVSIGGVELEGTENSSPSVTGLGSLWTAGSWVWNPPGDSWPVTIYASDVSGICSSSANRRKHPAEWSVGAAGHDGLAAVPEPSELAPQRRYPLPGARPTGSFQYSPQRNQRGRSWRPRRRS